MKILFIISSLGSGGAERVLSNLANRMSQAHDITIATFSNNRPFYALSEDVTHIKLDLLQPSSSALQSLKNNAKRLNVLMQTMKDIDADVNISFMTQTNLLAIVASRLRTRKIIVAERIAYDFQKSRLIVLLRRILYPFSNYVITQTVEDSRHYNFVKKLSVIYNPVLIGKTALKKECIVLAVGRLDPQKGFDLLIDTFARIESTGWQLLIAGDGPERESLLRRIEDLKVDNVSLIGNQKDISSWYAKASIFVLSSKKEGFPNVLIEAMASGCAVVSFACPSGPTEIIEHEKNGLLVEDQNRATLASALERVMYDKTLREKLGSNAIKVRERYAVEKIVAEWEEIIQEVVG